jgi:hypothetical protein
MPNRILKESICTSDTVDCLSWFEEVFFYRLLVNCDDYGRMDARVPILKARMFPLKQVNEKDMSATLSRLQEVGLILVYECEGRPYLQITTWDRHQQVRAKRSKYPAYDETCNQLISDDSICPRNPIQSNPIRIQSESLSNTISPTLSGESVSIEDVFDKTYAIYPRKEGKTKGRQAYVSYLKKGRNIGGKRVRLNHQQIYFAVQAYAANVEGKDKQYIQHFDTFMNSTVLDYVDQTKQDYEAWMAERYGEDWQNIKFDYTVID